jgi:hypothetical protein
MRQAYKFGFSDPIYCHKTHYNRHFGLLCAKPKDSNSSSVSVRAPNVTILVWQPILIPPKAAEFNPKVQYIAQEGSAK